MNKKKDYEKSSFFMGLCNKKSSFFVFGMIIRFFLSASDGSTLKNGKVTI